MRVQPDTARRSASSSFHTIQQVTRCHLLGGLLLLLLLLLSISFILICRCCLLNDRCGLFSFGFFLDGNKEADNILGLDHVVFINLEFTEDVVNFSLGHLVSPGHQSMLEHLGVNLASLIVGLESLDNEVIRVVAITGHLLLEHLDHVVVGAGTSDLAQKAIELSLRHEDTNVVKSTTEVIFVKLAILVDVHELEAVFVHLELVLGETSLILALAHLVCCVYSVVSNMSHSLLLFLLYFKSRLTITTIQHPKRTIQSGQVRLVQPGQLCLPVL